jgi:hypothetical protein
LIKATRIRPEFVDRIPKTLEQGVIYISEKYSTAAHNCCCGCGVKIMTPLKPGRWRLKVAGGRVSIYPSIGNWSSACQSHYWIEGNQIRWYGSLSKDAIKANRASDKRALQRAHAERREREKGFWAHLWDSLKGWWSKVKNAF